MKEEEEAVMQKLVDPAELAGNAHVDVHNIGTDWSFKRKIVWFNAIGFLLLLSIGVVGVAMAGLGYCKWQTTAWSLLLAYGAGVGVTMGAHRLWAHRAFKARTWLKVFLLVLHTVAGQNCLWVWVRDHRQHHKYSDTDADPHNATRGFFFSHCGWLMSRKHPKVFEYGKKVDMSDIEADEWIMFQKDHYKLLYTMFALALPILIPVWCWDENLWISTMVSFFGRTFLNLNVTWSVNSAAHLFGMRPYDKHILPVESMFVSLLTVGEGWHNYHHAFPWDYRASELGMPFNVTARLIDWLASWGAIYDLKAATSNMVKSRMARTGDGTHLSRGEKNDSQAETFMNLWKHPLNPTYNSIHLPSDYARDRDRDKLQFEDVNNNERKCNHKKI